MYCPVARVKSFESWDAFFHELLIRTTPRTPMLTKLMITMSNVILKPIFIMPPKNKSQSLGRRYYKIIEESKNLSGEVGFILNTS